MEDIFVILRPVFICRTEVSKVFSASGSVHAGVEVCSTWLVQARLAHTTVKETQGVHRAMLEVECGWSHSGVPSLLGTCRVCIASSVRTGPGPRKTGVWVGKNHKDIASGSLHGLSKVAFHLTRW